jgi:hypothetical protein
MSLPNAEGVSTSGGFTRGADEQVESLVAAIAGVIRAAKPEQRAELKDLAESLLHDEISTIGEASTPTAIPARPFDLNPLAAGILIVLLGIGFFLIFPLVGVTLAAIGGALVLWGGVISWRNK